MRPGTILQGNQIATLRATKGRKPPTKLTWVFCLSVARGEDVKHLANISAIECVDFDKTNIELGATCKKPFGVMIVSIRRGKK